MSETNPPRQLPVPTNSPVEQLPVPTRASPERLPVPAYTDESLHALVKRAESGDEATLPELRRLLALPGVGATLDLARRVRDTLLDKLTGRNLLNRELVSIEANRLRDELLGTAATPVERLLVEQIVIAWLQLHDTDLRAARVCEHIGKGNLMYRRADLVHRRFLAALRTLALVRRLAGPALQVNIAERQVNVSG